MTNIAERINSLDAEIRGLEEKHSRLSGEVRLLAVSKRHSIGKIREAAASGLRDFGENYLQEGLDKIEQLQDLDLCWHFIGPIQSNKTRGIAEHFHWVHSIDRLKVAQRLSDQRPANLPPLNVCVQINLSEENTKSGTTLASAASLCKHIATMPRLILRGLMAIPAPLQDFDAQRACFAELRALFVGLQNSYVDMDTLSMGMSNDYPAAIAEGSTMIRLGTAIFGPREQISTNRRHR